MGGSTSVTVVKKAAKPLKNYNVQNRAEKVFEKQKSTPNPAPKHPTTEELLKQHAAANPHIKEELSTKNEAIVDRMNKLRLEVTGKSPQIKSTNPERPLPQSRRYIDDPLHLSEKPVKVPVGRISLVQAAEILGKHKKSPNEYTAKVIANEYNLDLDQTYCLLQNFYSLDMDDNQLLDLSAVQQSLIKKMMVYPSIGETKEGKK